MQSSVNDRAPFDAIAHATIPDAASGIVAAERVTLLAEEAGLWVARTIADSDDMEAGARLAARYQTAADQRYHIQFLAGALATGQLAFFTDYAAWLAVTVAARGVPIASVVQSFALIGQFYSRRLAAGEIAAVRAVLGDGIAALDRERQAQAATGADSDSGSDPGSGPGPGGAADGGPVGGGAWPEVPALVDRLIAGDSGGAWVIATAAVDRRSSYIDIATRLFQPALYRIGLLWQSNRISVAQEHLATEISRVLLAQLLHWAAPFSPPIGRKALFAAVEHDRHVLGLQVVAEAFQIAGWTVQYLGASTPALPLVRQIAAWGPEVVGLSVSLSQHLPVLKRSIETLRGELGSRCPAILVGGRPTNQISGIWRWTGADGWGRDAGQAVAEVR